MSPFKEPHFFSRPTVDTRHAAHFRQISAEDTYRGLFIDGAGAAIVGESSTSYLWDAGACARIAERCPSAKIVICLRDPVERAFSHYLDNVRDGLERRPFTQALTDEHVHGADWFTAYCDVGRYAGQVQRYVDAFGSSILVLYFERLVGAPEAELRRLITFLGLDANTMPGWELASANRHAAPRNALSARVLESGLVRSAASVVPSAVRARAYSRLTRPSARPDMPADARAWLTEQYAEEACRLKAVIGTPPPWRWASPADVAAPA
jgi:sulfotransferase family protein